MKNFLLILLSFFVLTTIANSAIVQNDNNNPKGHYYEPSKEYWEESAVLIPDGPCDVNTIMIYYSGDNPARDTLWICGFPTAGNLFPTHYIWDYNTLIEPIVYEYDGVPGWKEIDVTGMGLRSDGFDAIVIQHFLKQNGPWFTYDSDGISDTYEMDGNLHAISWLCDSYRPNPNFYNIQGTMHYMAQGDFMIRLDVEYDYPDGNTSKVPPAPSFVQVNAKAGISGGSEISIADWNGDGWDDIAMRNKFFQNNGDGTFTNVSSDMGINSRGTSWGDYDNDGDLDCYAMQYGNVVFDDRMEENANHIYQNNGDGTFSLVEDNDIFNLPYPDPGVDFDLSFPLEQELYHNPYRACSPFWLDYNNDGHLDIFIANKRIEISGKPEIYCPDEIWLNNGDGTFTNKRTEANLASGEPWDSEAAGIGGYLDCYGASAIDYNKDNKTDIFVANYRLAPDNLYQNQGDGTFNDVGQSTGVRGEPTAAPQYFGHGMGSEWGDFNNDTYPDLCVGNLAHTDSRGLFSNPSLIYKNLGPDNNYTFEEVHKEMGLKFHEGNAGVCWADFNLDGYLDIWHGVYSGSHGKFYLNQGPPDYKLHDMTWIWGGKVQNAWEAVRLDYDHDGDLDMLVKNILYRNDIVREGNWVAFRLVGSPENSVNMDCYGAKVIVTAGEMTYYREIAGSGAGTHTNQNSNELHFGIGDNETIDEVKIEYPNGEVYPITEGVQVNNRYIIPYKGQAVRNGVPTPAQKSPRNMAIVDGILNLALYDYAPETSYHIQVASDEAFENILFESTETTADVEFTPEGNGSYYWRAQATLGDEKSAWSAAWSFIVGVPIPSAPALESPANEATEVSATTSFSWDNSSYDVGFTPRTAYDIEISQDETFSEVEISGENVEGNEFNHRGVLEAGKIYYWHVRGVNRETENGEGPWSETFSFTVMPLPATPTLSSPADGEETSKRPDLIWEETQYADGYHFQVAFDEEFTDIHTERDDWSSSKYRTLLPYPEGTTLYWHVRALNIGGYSEWSETRSFITEGESSVNNEDNGGIKLFSPWPNPADKNVSLKFSLPFDKFVTIELLDMNGRKISTISEAHFASGEHQIEFETSHISSGSYVIKFSSGRITLTKKLIIEK